MSNLEKIISNKTGIPVQDIKYVENQENFYALINLKDVKVDFYDGNNENYQRALDKKNLNNIKDNHDDNLADAPVLAIRADNTVHCPDGSHRIHARIERGQEKVFARCFISKGSQHEAYVFSKGNSGRKAISKPDAFIANVAMGSEDEVAVDSLLKKYNLLSNAKSCINIIMHAYKNNNATLTIGDESKTSFEWMLDFLSNDLRGDKKYFIEAIIGGLSSFLNLLANSPKMSKNLDIETFRAYVKSLYSICNFEDFKSELSRKMHTYSVKIKKTEHPNMRRKVACWTHQYMYNKYIKKNKINVKPVNFISVNLELKK